MAVINRILQDEQDVRRFCGSGRPDRDFQELDSCFRGNDKNVVFSITNFNAEFATKAAPTGKTEEF